MTKGFDIPPDAVRVWRGYRANNVALQDFFAKLGTVFVPATVEMQIAAGLDGYVPSIPAGLPNKPDAVPDETAILFWDSQETYKDAFDTLAVRTYTLTHGPVYRPPSTAQFPVAFAGTVVSEMPYYLVDRPADWMHGKVTHLIGERSSTVEPDEFRTRLAAILSEIQRQNKVLGAIVCAGDDYLVYWELGDVEVSDGIAALKALLNWSHIFTPASTQIASGLWDAWPGMAISADTSLNLQFRRRWERQDRNGRPVAPCAVHVWRGYKAAGLSYPDFVSFLGGTFVPAALLLQPGAGLNAYIPSVTPGGGGGILPDQTALLFWADQQSYKNAYGTVAVRAYKGLHSRIFDEPPSKTGFPIPFSGSVEGEQPYYLFDRPTDWMLGSVRYFIGTRSTGQPEGDFLTAVSNWIAAYRKAPPLKVDGAIICAGSNYVVFWEHVSPGESSYNDSLDSLAKIATPHLSKTSETYTPPAGLWSQWPGIDLLVHNCINVQLDR